MYLGDFLEWLAAAALVTAAFLWSGLILALAVAGVWLAYFAQCHDGTKLVLPRLRLRRRQKTTALDGKAVWRCDKCGGEHYLGLQAGHVCKAAA
jgi:hypothetical protein